MNMQETINEARKLDIRRLELNKEVAKLESSVAEHKRTILSAMLESEQAEVTTKAGAWAATSEKSVLQVKDWTKLYAFIIGCYELEADHEQDVALMMLQRRPADAVIKTFMEMHGLTAEQVGVEFVDINVVRLGGKLA